MNKRMITSVLCCLLMATGASAQEKLFNGVNVQSPVKNGDGTVTLNLFAPEARKVTVSGDFLPVQKVQTPMGEVEQAGVAELTKDDKSGASLRANWHRNFTPTHSMWTAST